MWLRENAAWIFSGIGATAVGALFAWLPRRGRRKQKAPHIQTGTISQSTNIQAGGDVHIRLGPEQVNRLTREVQHAVSLVDVGKPRDGSGKSLRVIVRLVHDGARKEIEVSEQESIWSLTDKARTALALGNTAAIEGSRVPMQLHWVLVDEKAVSEWKALSDFDQSMIHGYIKVDGKIRQTSREDTTLEELGVYEGMEARLFRVSAQDEGSRDCAMLTSAR
jgi:hypothetical protein